MLQAFFPSDDFHAEKKRERDLYEMLVGLIYHYKIFNLQTF